MGAGRPGRNIYCNANYRHVISSERTPHFGLNNFSGLGMIMKYLIMGPKRGFDTKADWPTDRRPKFNLTSAAETQRREELFGDIPEDEDRDDSVEPGFRC
jgi:hypothetical protein